VEFPVREHVRHSAEISNHIDRISPLFRLFRGFSVRIHQIKVVEAHISVVIARECAHEILERLAWIGIFFKRDESIASWADTGVFVASFFCFIAEPAKELFEFVLKVLRLFLLDSSLSTSVSKENGRLKRFIFTKISFNFYRFDFLP